MENCTFFRGIIDLATFRLEFFCVSFFCLAPHSWRCLSSSLYSCVIMRSFVAQKLIMVDHSALKEKCLITANIILRFFSGQNVILIFIRMVAIYSGEYLLLYYFPRLKTWQKISQKIWMLRVSQPFLISSVLNLLIFSISIRKHLNRPLDFLRE